MADRQEDVELGLLLDGLRQDAVEYFQNAQAALRGEVPVEALSRRASMYAEPVPRDQYWNALPAEIRAEAIRLRDRLVSLMGQVARAARSALLASEADRNDVMTGAKAMRATLLLRRFRSWNVEVLHDEGSVLGTTPAGQSDDEPCIPAEAERTFTSWAEKIGEILNLVAASHELVLVGSGGATEAAQYRPGTAFILMWMDQTQPELTDVADSVKEVFRQFGIHAVRADDIQHDELITQRVLDEIKTAEFRFADLSGNRPNVYYEVGYAHALGRRVILFRKAGTGLHFDLAGYNCPEYQNLRDLKDQLIKRLRAMTGREPKN